jgi:DNA invertase Pin-like site-specific DNA recombinase
MSQSLRDLKSANTKPVAYGYARISHQDGWSKGESVNSQIQRINEYYQRNLKDKGVQWGGVCDDGTNVSAYRIPFQSRPAGKELLSKMKDGDYLILDKVDRFVRSAADFARVMEMFKNRNIKIHIVQFLDSSIQTETYLGQFTLQLCVMMAELESAIKSERICEALAVKRKKGERLGPFIPPGCTTKRIRKGDRHVSVLVWCPKQLDILNELVRLIDDEGLEWRRVFPKIEEYAANVEKRERKNLKKQQADHEKWRLRYQYATAYRFLDIQKTEQIPRKEVIAEAARQYKRNRTLSRAKQRNTRKRSQIKAISKEQLLAANK